MFFLFAALATTLGIYGTDLKSEAKSIDLESMSLTYGNPALSYTFTSSDYFNNKEYIYTPEVVKYAGIEISTGTFSLGATFTDGSTDYEKDDPDYRDPSKVFDVQLSGVKGQYIWHAFYQKYSGFYLEAVDDDTEEISALSNQEYNTSYELSSERVGLGILYAFNTEIKPEKLIGSSSKERETGKSWVLGVTMNKGALKSSDSILPQNIEGSFDGLAEVSKIETETIGIEGGVLGQYAWRNFFINSMLTLMSGVQYQKITNGTTKKESASVLGTALTLDMGYRFDESFLGFAIASYGQAADIEESNVSSSRTTSAFYYRYFF